MEKLKNKIIKEGRALNKEVLKVDSFLNHKVDVKLMYEIGTNFKEYFKERGITKVFTIESSGIAPAAMAALQMEVELVILKKQASNVLKDNLYTTKVHSFTKDVDYNLVLDKKYISSSDKILVIDDFLANGEAAMGAIRLIEEAGAKVSGIGIVIEKAFQPGRKILDEKGYDTYSLARISKLDEGVVEFLD